MSRATLGVKRPCEGGITAPAIDTGCTPLQEQLAGASGRPTVLDAFRRARRTFRDGRRVDMGVLARELDVNRATLYRWVGSRE
ncbi:MAG: hypothetical protein AB7V44_15660, partial [Pseudonocardia sp.]